MSDNIVDKLIDLGTRTEYHAMHNDLVTLLHVLPDYNGEQSYDNRVQRLCDTRLTKARCRAWYDAALENFRAIPEVAEIIEGIAKLKSDEADITADLKTHAVEHFGITGEKKLPFGIGIRVTKKVQYDSDEALAWARENAPDLLTLDTKRFEKAVKAGTFTSAPAEVFEVPTGTIPSNLVPHLATVADND